MLANLYDDIQGILLQKFNNTDLIMLCNVNKKYYNLVFNHDLKGKLECHTIASYGYLGVLKWAKENGCYWDLNTCSFAASGTFRNIKMGQRK